MYAFVVLSPIRRSLSQSLLQCSSPLVIPLRSLFAVGFAATAAFKVTLYSRRRCRLQSLSISLFVCTSREELGGFEDVIFDACCKNIASDDEIWHHVVEASVLLVSLAQKSNPHSQCRPHLV